MCSVKGTNVLDLKWVYWFLVDFGNNPCGHSIQHSSHNEKTGESIVIAERGRKAIMNSQEYHSNEVKALKETFSFIALRKYFANESSTFA